MPSDPLGCRASGLTPELPVHVVKFSPLLVPQLLRLQVLVPEVQRQSHHHFYFLDFPRNFCFARFGAFEKGLDFTRAANGIVQSTHSLVCLQRRKLTYGRGRLSDGHIAMKLKKTTYTSGINQYCLQSPLPCRGLPGYVGRHIIKSQVSSSFTPNSPFLG